MTSLTLTLALLAAFTLALLETPSLAQRARWFPQAVALMGIAFCTIHAALLSIAAWRARARPSTPMSMRRRTPLLAGVSSAASGARPEQGRERKDEGLRARPTYWWVLWALGLVALATVLGSRVASAIWLTSFLMYEARSSWRVTTVYIACYGSVVLLLGRFTDIGWPGAIFGPFA